MYSQTHLKSNKSQVPRGRLVLTATALFTLSGLGSQSPAQDCSGVKHADEKLVALAEALPLRHNIPLPTLGGRQWWGDGLVADGWRMQQHTTTGHWRLLDSHGLRRAWGTYLQCRHALDAQIHAGHVLPLQGDVVLCAHGLGRTRAMWEPIAHDLRAAGFSVVAVSWPSTREPLAVSAQRLRNLIANMPEVRSVSVVTHSLGGPLIRQVWATPIPGAPPLRAAVFAFAPHQGAHLADRFHTWKPLQWVLGPTLQMLPHDQAAQHFAPWSASPALCISGQTAHGGNPLIPGPDDGIVAVADTVLPGAEQRIFSVSHTFGLRDPAVRKAVVQFVQQHQSVDSSAD